MAENKLNPEILKNPLLILESADVLAALKRHWIGNHENLIQPEKFAEEFFGYLEKSAGQGSISNQEIKKYYKKKLKEYRNTGLPAEKPGDMFVELLRDEVSDIETVLDFGCGKLAFLKNMAERYGSVKKFIGVDPKSRPVLAGLDPRIEFLRGLDGIADASADLAVIKLVLHHLDNNQEAQDIFAQLKRVLRPGGKLIVFEESFLAGVCAIKDIKDHLAKFDLEISGATQDFLQLSESEKIQFLFLNDWLMNLQNPYMPWTGLYKSMEDWIALIESAGFQKQSGHFLGAIKHRKRKQGMTTMLVFSR
ncbi:MAG: class I SAM-dependent methyltransferase [Candidatus Moranbacteria bacterium]|nr:class I SAM-dependent methyltransferase [Candidatus Moranbacteria bacterium]